ncbi:MAG: TM2 domain-containing protein [Cytophagaceae bacterium]|nr:TM2 domain-containing protein [Cytophagaceae bacterium]MDW8456678.1 TM2 domain-containing protein [Cytophagaceae bacterium]
MKKLSLLLISGVVLFSSCAKKQYQANFQKSPVKVYGVANTKNAIVPNTELSAITSSSDNRIVVSENVLPTIKSNPTSERTTKSNATTERTNNSEVKSEKLSVKEKAVLKKINKLSDNKGNDKNWVVALILCWLLGGLGIHRFYLGYTWQGIVQLLTVGGCGIWALIDFIRIIMKTLKPKDGDYI